MRMAVLFLALALSVAPGCERSSSETPTDPPESAAAEPDDIAVIRMKAGGEMRIRLFADVAPGHVKNFKHLARSGFYDGTTFHRVIPDFMIQGGDPNSKDDDPTNDGRGTPGYFIPDEFSDVPHRRGIVALGNQGRPNTGGCQFYIMVADSPEWRKVLDGKYSVFGEVIDGMEVADRIVAAPRDRRDRPLEPEVMESVTIEAAPAS